MDLERLERPEYLSDQELKEVLLFYGVPVLDDMARSSVLELIRKIAQPLPQREKRTINNADSRSCKNEKNKREQMDIDDDVIDLKKPKLASVSVSPLRNQFDNVFCISNRKDSHESIDVNSYDSNIRKRQSSSSLPSESCKDRKLRRYVEN